MKGEFSINSLTAIDMAVMERRPKQEEKEEPEKEDEVGGRLIC